MVGERGTRRSLPPLPITRTAAGSVSTSARCRAVELGPAGARQVGQADHGRVPDPGGVVVGPALRRGGPPARSARRHGRREGGCRRRAAGPPPAGSRRCHDPHPPRRLQRAPQGGQVLVGGGGGVATLAHGPGQGGPDGGGLAEAQAGPREGVDVGRSRPRSRPRWPAGTASSSGGPSPDKAGDVDPGRNLAPVGAPAHRPPPAAAGTRWAPRFRRRSPEAPVRSSCERVSGSTEMHSTCGKPTSPSDNLPAGECGRTNRIRYNSNVTTPMIPPIDSTICALPGCGVAVVQPAGGGRKRLYCTNAHRAEARRRRLADSPRRHPESSWVRSWSGSPPS